MAKHIEKAPLEYSMCTGCVSCEMVCSMVHEGYVSPQTKRLFFKAGPVKTMLHEIYTCQQCDDHPCYEACPKKDEAMCIDENGIVYVNEKNCIGCGKCAKACKFTPSRIHVVKSKDKEERKAKKCDLCRTRPEGPACVQWCPFMCLAVSDRLPWEERQETDQS
ncbi:MAG TPA: hydrogenase [Lachnospiraceae bacterium]|nr:hydrogenase [Lachnospiraceae bacterium]